MGKGRTVSWETIERRKWGEADLGGDETGGGEDGKGSDGADHDSGLGAS